MHANPTQMRLAAAKESSRDLLDDYWSAREEHMDELTNEERALVHANHNDGSL